MGSTYRYSFYFIHNIVLIKSLDWKSALKSLHCGLFSWVNRICSWCLGNWEYRCSKIPWLVLQGQRICLGQLCLPPHLLNYSCSQKTSFTSATKCCIFWISNKVSSMVHFFETFWMCSLALERHSWESEEGFGAFLKAGVCMSKKNSPSPKGSENLQHHQMSSEPEHGSAHPVEFESDQ